MTPVSHYLVAMAVQYCSTWNEVVAGEVGEWKGAGQGLASARIPMGDKSMGWQGNISGKRIIGEAETSIDGPPNLYEWFNSRLKVGRMTDRH